MKKANVLAGLVVLAMAMAAQATPIADSVADFSGVQGQNNWSYLEVKLQYPWVPDYNPANATSLTYDGGKWVSNMGISYLMIGASTTHPGATGEFNDWATVRRWQSTVTGTVTISGELTDVQTGDGDGVSGFIYVGDTKVWGLTNISDGGSTTYSFTTSVTAGQNVDFVLSPFGAWAWNAACDTTKFTATIVPEPVTIGLICLGGLFGVRRRS